MKSMPRAPPLTAFRMPATSSALSPGVAVRPTTHVLAGSRCACRILCRVSHFFSSPRTGRTRNWTSSITITQFRSRRVGEGWFCAVIRPKHFLKSHHRVWKVCRELEGLFLLYRRRPTHLSNPSPRVGRMPFHPASMRALIASRALITSVNGRRGPNAGLEFTNPG